MDEEEEKVTSKPLDDGITPNNKETKTGSNRPFGGLKKGFLNSEAKMKSSDTKVKAADVRQIDRNTSLERNTGTKCCKGHRKNKTRDEEQQCGEFNEYREKHQTMDKEEGKKTSKPIDDGGTANSKKTKTGCDRPFGGLKKGFLKSEAKKKYSDTKSKASDVRQSDRNTSLERNSGTECFTGYRKNKTRDEEQERGEPSTSSESFPTTSHVDGAVSKSDPGDVYRQQWKFNGLLQTK